MRLVISGSESFIGAELRRLCARRHIEYAGIDVMPSEDPSCRVGDVCAEGLLELVPRGADAFVHLAAVSTNEACQRDPRRAFEVNIVGTLNAYSAATTREIRQFIFASTEWVYGDRTSEIEQTEDASIDIRSLSSEYALSKLAGEQLLAIAQARGGPSVAVLRFGIVYGPRAKNGGAVEDLFHKIRFGETVEIRGSLRSARRYIHVTDVAEGILAAVGQRGFQVFNLTGDRLVTLGEVICQSVDLVGRAPRVLEYAPASVSIRNPPNDKARRILGWSPKVSLREGLRTLFEPGPQD